MGYSPISANPRVKDNVGGFKAWAIGSSRLSVSFNPIILFKYPFVVKDSCVMPKEILEVKRTGSDLFTFI